MLIAGNYRCVTKEGPRAIKDAVHSDINASRVWVVNLCLLLGAKESDLVPFDKYAAAAQTLGSPSSAARALYGGAPYIERVDRLVQAIAAQKGLRLPALDEVVGRSTRNSRRTARKPLKNRGQSPISGITAPPWEIGL